ncbi:MAG: MBL fold metallo-hydrolase [Bacteroidales bacterium]|nr:MBL fold metallo-hydrolase [Bacteroidales bacterium]
MIEFCSLASGSNGNCYYIGNETDAVLIDGGISNRRFMERAETAQIDTTKIRSLFVSHEHYDHVAGLKSISHRHNIPVYFSAATYNALSRRKRPQDYKLFDGVNSVKVASNIEVFPFKKHHDAVDPYSFIVKVNDSYIGIITDIGVADSICVNSFSKCRVVFLEMNYDYEMLQNGSYPQYLKERIHSENGHLSNTDAINLIQNHSFSGLSHIIASHISAENNSHSIIEKLIEPFANRYCIELAPRFAAGNHYVIDD